ncbi:acyltransferase [Cyanobacteria bacterium FACHB-471]|nr:acyltransferase [Cyanobacteria bacterium FACHB-471]
MTAANPLPQSRWTHYKEAILTTLVGWVPLSVGTVLRRLLYRAILARVGAAVEIRPGVELINADCLELGDRVKIDRHVRIRNIGQNTIRIGDRVTLNRGVDIKMHSGNGGQIEIGQQTAIGPYTCLSGRQISIGRDCLIAPQVGIFASSHVFTELTRSIREQGQSYKGIVIENNCWLGSGVKVLDGVTIGEGSIIGANAVVTKDIPAYSIATGIPAKVVRRRVNENDTKLHTSELSAITALVTPP